MKILKIKSSRMEFFVKYLLVINEMLKLRNTALIAFARILYWNDKYKYLDAEERHLIVFNTITRSKILQSIDMSRASLDNQFSYLRKKKILIGNRINPIYEIYYDTHNQLMFSFELEDEE